MTLDAFVSVGLYDPESPSAEQRRELLEHLLSRGHTADEIISAAGRTAQTTDIAVALTRDFPERITLREAAHRGGAPIDEVRALRVALGLTVTGDDVAEVPSTFTQDFELYRLASENYGREATLGFARVLGSALSTVTEAARELFTAPQRGTGATELEISLANEVGFAAWDELRTVVSHLMLERAGRDSWFEAALLSGDPVFAVVFVDLVDSAAWTERQSAAEHSAALARFEKLASQLALSRGGRVVKFIGDEAMIVAVDPVAATTIAVELCAAAADDPSLPPVRGAVGYGQVTARGGDYFGALVNATSRATKVADANKVVVMANVARCLDGESWTLSPPRQVQLRGITESVELYDVAPVAAEAT